MYIVVSVGQISRSRTAQRSVLSFPFKIKLIIIPSLKDFALPWRLSKTKGMDLLCLNSSPL